MNNIKCTYEPQVKTQNRNGGLFMSENREFFDGLFGGNCAILWFIILFLLLFWGCGGYGLGGYAYKENPLDPDLAVE